MIYQFEDLELDIGRRELSREGIPVKLPKLSFNLLQALVEAAPDLLTHEEIIDRVWGADRVITPENLSQRVKMLRESLGDDAQHPRYIESVHGQGVRLMPSVRPLGEPRTPPVAEPEAAGGRPARFLPGLVLVLLTGVALVLVLVWFQGGEDYQRRSTDSGGSTATSIAVLPFTNLSPNPENSFFAAGIHEEVLNQLAKLTNLRVISRTSMLRYQDTTKPIPAIADELGVDTLIAVSYTHLTLPTTSRV